MSASRRAKPLAPLPIGDDVRDRDDLEPVLLGELQELGQALDRAVVIDELGEHAHGRITRERRQIDGGLGVPGTGEHATLLGHQRKDVAGPHEVLGADVVVRERA